MVALRKESVDRNIFVNYTIDNESRVALRKESVDRNTENAVLFLMTAGSLSARRAWIEIGILALKQIPLTGRSPQGERG